MLANYLVLTKVLLKSFLRDRQNVFFTLALPLIFLVIFGSVYDGAGEGRIFRVSLFVNREAVGDELQAALEEATGIQLQEVQSLAELEEAVRTMAADFGLAWDGQRLGVYTNPVRIQDNAYFRQIAQGLQATINRQRSGMVDLIQLHRRSMDSGVAQGLRFLLPGIIALGTLSSGLFAISASFLHYKDKKVLKRLMATTMRKGSFLAALMTTRLVTGFISAFLVLAVGSLVFQTSYKINWVLFVPYVPISTIAMMGLGALVTLISKTSENAVQISSILMTIMMFFSGVYFPIEFLPTYFQPLTAVLPLSYVTRGFRFVMGVESLAFSRFLLETLLLLVASLVLTWIATVHSRWTEG